MPTNHNIHSRMLSLAAEMARQKNMPSSYREDWTDLPPDLTRKGWREIQSAAEQANKQCQLWAIMLREAADWLNQNMTRRDESCTRK